MKVCQVLLNISEKRGLSSSYARGEEIVVASVEVVFEDVFQNALDPD